MAFNAIRRAVQQQGIQVPNNWNPNDSKPFYDAIAKGILSKAEKAFDDAVAAKLGGGVTLPKDLIDQDRFAENPVIQKYWHKGLGIPDGSPLRLNMGLKEFEAAVVKPLLDQQVAHLEADFRSGDESFADGGKFERTGRKAYEGLIVPPIALCFSLGGAIVHICKLLNYSLKATPIRNKQILYSTAVAGYASGVVYRPPPSPPRIGDDRHGKSIGLGLVIVFAVGFIITITIGFLPCSVTESPLYEGVIYPDVSEQHGPEIAGVMTWIIKAECYGYPFNEWLRHDLLFNWQFPPLWPPPPGTDNSDQIFAEDNQTPAATPEKKLVDTAPAPAPADASAQGLIPVGTQVPGKRYAGFEGNFSDFSDIYPQDGIRISPGNIEGRAWFDFGPAVPGKYNASFTWMDNSWFVAPKAVQVWNWKANRWDQTTTIWGVVRNEQRSTYGFNITPELIGPQSQVRVGLWSSAPAVIQLKNMELDRSR